MNQNNCFCSQKQILKKYLDNFIMQTQQAVWLWEINLDDIKIQFCDFELKYYCKVKFNKLLINTKYQINDIFPYFIGSLWILKLKKDSYIEYLFLKYFCKKKLLISIKDKIEFAYNWFKSSEIL